MVMQVRYLYEAEGNKKAKDAKAVSLLFSFLLSFLPLIVRSNVRQGNTKV